MTTTTEYGTWNNYGDRDNVTVEATIADVVNGADSDWREAMEAAGMFKRIAADYREAINDALPDGVSLARNDFYGPYYEADMDFDGYLLNEDGELDIPAIIADIDLQEIIERYDIPALLEAERNAAHAAVCAQLEADAKAQARAEAVAKVVQACGGHQSQAAELLGIDRSRVSRMVAKAERR